MIIVSGVIIASGVIIVSGVIIARGAIIIRVIISRIAVKLLPGSQNRGVVPG